MNLQKSGSVEGDRDFQARIDRRIAELIETKGVKNHLLHGRRVVLLAELQDMVKKYEEDGVTLKANQAVPIAVARAAFEEDEISFPPGQDSHLSTLLKNVGNTVRRCSDDCRHLPEFDRIKCAEFCERKRRGKEHGYRVWLLV